MDKVVTEESLEEGERTIFGRLHGSPSINFQAFQTTMKKAWKTENMIHIVGLPVEGRKEEVIMNVARKIGEVVEVKIEKRGIMGIAVSKAKVVLNLDSPLESGMIYSFKGKMLWLDFRYERLPTFCYSCGKIGHYAQNCQEIPYNEESFSDIDNQCYGSWLRTEMNLQSPFWKSFYEAKIEEDLEEETIPETPEIYGFPSRIQGKGWRGKSSSASREERGKRKMWEIELGTLLCQQNKGSGGNVEARPLMIKLPSFQIGREPQDLEQEKTIVREVKKGRTGSSYGQANGSDMMLDEVNLLETPVISVGEAKLRALVASPNKPLGYK